MGDIETSHPFHPVTLSDNLPGPHGIAVGVMDPLKCFHLFLSHELYDDILAQSNLYAQQQRAAKNDTSPWKPITKDELMVYIGMNIAMGVISLPKLDQYWSTDPILPHPWFHTVMSHDRFREILQYIHVIDNTQAPSRSNPNYDKLRKIRPLITALEKNCRELYSPHQQLSVDESIIGTKSRLSFIQYMPAKPVKWGVKVWVLCDSINWVHMYF